MDISVKLNQVRSVKRERGRVNLCAPVVAAMGSQSYHNARRELSTKAAHPRFIHVSTVSQRGVALPACLCCLGKLRGPCAHLLKLLHFLIVFCSSERCRKISINSVISRCLYCRAVYLMSTYNPKLRRLINCDHKMLLGGGGLSQIGMSLVGGNAHTRA